MVIQQWTQKYRPFEDITLPGVSDFVCRTMSDLVGLNLD